MCAFVCYDQVERNAVRLRINGLQMHRFKTNSNCERFWFLRRQRPVEIAATVAEAISIGHPANQWGEHNLGGTTGASIGGTRRFQSPRTILECGVHETGSRP